MQIDRLKGIIFDFDGVLCDSMEECLVVSYRAFLRQENRPTTKTYDKANVPNDKASLFRRFRYLVRTAPEYRLLWRLIDCGQVPDASKTLIEQSSGSSAELSVYKNLFFDERAAWLDRDRCSWLNHNPLYAGIKTLLDSPEILKRCWIVSSKNETAMKAILAHNGIALEASRFFGSETGFDKDHLLQELIRDINATPSALIFIDDNLTNLLKAKSIGIQTTMATWGYTGNTEKEKAVCLGINLLTLESLPKLISRVMMA